MRRFFLGVLAATVLPASAQAATQKVAPPGNSAVNQYVEQIPTAGGGTPSGSIPPVTKGNGPGGGTGSGGAISRSTQRALSSQGRDGSAAAVIANATAPVGVPAAAGGRAGRAGRTASSAGGSQPITPAAASSGSSPASSVLKALTGSSSGTGLGVVLPVILIGSLIGAMMIALLRRRRTTT